MKGSSPRALVALVALLAASACGPKVAPQISATPPVTAYDQKMRWILQLEDERQLKGGGGDILALLQDPEGRVRRRAALAGGRVRLPEAVPGLITLLASDPDLEVRQMAAFAMGLNGDPSAAPALTAALAVLAARAAVATLSRARRRGFCSARAAPVSCAVSRRSRRRRSICFPARRPGSRCAG